MKFLIQHGFDVQGTDEFDVVEADSQEEAEELAKEEAYSRIDYSAQPLTKELAEEHGFEDEWEERDDYSECGYNELDGD